MSSPFLATIVITTKNRKEELVRALRSCLIQSVAVEILVIDDGSTDGTSEMIRSDFPTVRLERSEVSLGLIVQRNRGANLARSPVVISIDDDAEFSSTRVVEQTLEEIGSDPHIGAVAIPFREPNKENVLMQRAPSESAIWITEKFIGTAHAVRRDLFIRLDGYRGELVHQGEESDYSIRMLEAGYFVRLGNADPILHYESPKRDHARMDYYGSRNSVLFSWQNVPGFFLPIHLAATTFRCASLTFSLSRLATRLRGIASGYFKFLIFIRRPVSSSTYRLFRRMRKRGSITIEEAISESAT